MKYFMMSRRFNKSSPKDFCLFTNEGGELSLNDGSIWQPVELYDLGWGPENGYFRLPALSFEALFELGNMDTDEDNIYGAASTIINKYPDELLSKLEQVIVEGNLIKYKKFLKILKLDYPLNRTFRVGYSINVINAESEKWNKIAEIFKKL